MNNDKDSRVGQSTDDVADGFASCKLVKSGGGLIRFYRITCPAPRNLTDILGLSKVSLLQGKFILVRGN